MIGVVNRARAVFTALLVASGLGLAGCSGDDPEPQFAPPSSEAPGSPPSTTAAAGPTAPEMPEAAKGTDAAAAEAFVKHYWESVDYAQATGDLDELASLASKECKPCIAGLRYLRGVYARDGVISGGESRVDVLRTGFVRDAGKPTAVVRFKLTTTPQEVAYPDGENDEAFAGGSKVVNALLKPAGAGWVMAMWSVEA